MYKDTYTHGKLTITLGHVFLFFSGVRTDPV